MAGGGREDGTEDIRDTGASGETKLGKAESLGGLKRAEIDWGAEKVLVVVSLGWATVET